MDPGAQLGILARFCQRLLEHRLCSLPVVLVVADACEPEERVAARAAGRRRRDGLLEELTRPRRVPRLEAVVGGPQSSASERLAVRGRRKASRQIAELGGGIGRTPRAGDTCGLLEHGGELLVRLDRAEREMACPLLRIGDHLREPAMDAPSRRRRCSPVHDGCKQRMAESDIGSGEMDHPRPSASSNGHRLRLRGHSQALRSSGAPWLRRQAGNPEHRR